VTRALARLSRGDAIGVRGPFGRGWPVEEARGKDVLIIAGGLGLAPLRPAILEVLAHRHDYDRVIVLYGARSPQELLFRADVERWRGRFDVKLEAIVDRSGRDWYGAVGVVTSLLGQVPIDPEGTLAMVCGPEIMMRFTARELLALGVPADRVFVSLERSMKCGVGLCGHCQLGGQFVCKDGPVARWDRVGAMLNVREM
jgi:NAD(P)H-flavin reductase